MGTAHGGHDQCAHCYFTYIKPAIQAERQAVKGRRALKRLSASNRSLINQVDLDEPQLAPEPVASKAVREAIYDQHLDRLTRGLSPEAVVQVAGTELFKLHLSDVPVIIDGPVQPIREEQTQNVPGKMRGGPANPPLSPEAEIEVVEAYKLGQTVTEICRAYTISPPRLYEAVRKAGLPLRGSQPRKAPEMNQSTSAVSSMPVEKPSTNGVVSGLTEWVVTYTVSKTETMIVVAKGFSDAASSVSQANPGVEVISVAKKLP
jgi:hypothetical protein